MEQQSGENEIKDEIQWKVCNIVVMNQTIEVRGQILT